MKKNKLLLGCIADDFTGAGDIASFLEKGGLHTLLISGIPESDDIPDDVGAVVISLKSRTAPVGEAVRDTLQSVRYLETYGCVTYYIKYCSTFDSTPAGNIGPVLDAVLEYLGETYTVLCPSLPINGRTVKKGILYVNNIPLSESGMKNHPLTPMWDSRINVLMEGQSPYPCIVLERKYYSRPIEEAEAFIESQGCGQKHYYVVPDYEQDEDAVHIIQLFSQLKVFTGGSGLAAAYARYISAKAGDRSIRREGIKAEGAAFIAAGSISKATLGQINYYKEKGLSYYKICPTALWDKSETAETIWNDIKLILTEQMKPVLVYCSESQDDIVQGQAFGRQEFANLLEDTLAQLAERAAAEGICKIIVAGGETSGAVTKKLGYKSFYVGESVAPGVPVLVPAESPGKRLILKSGNFGQADFFIRSLEMTKE